MSGPDPFDTAALRSQVLATWSSAPDRLREDANAEEDLVLGGYRDRLIVELGQNASDAALAAGEPGRLDLALRTDADGSLLVAANTGRPLDAAGVRALATLRASAKRDEHRGVGRFGVGFAAVLAVCDAPTVLSRDGGVRFSRAETAAEIERLRTRGPADEARRRGGQVPALRLPWPESEPPPAGWDTAVVLALRDEAALELTRRLLDEVDDALLLALPGLESIDIRIDAHHRRISGAAHRWHTLTRSGVLDERERADLLADRPTEERARPWWSLLWALPKDPAQALDGPGVLHAPTPTDEPMAWPALLLASYPLEPSRRHVAPGPMADWLSERAAAAYADLLAERAADDADVLDLVPGGLPAGPVDAAIRARVLHLLPDVALLAPVAGGRRLRPSEAVMIEGAAGADPPALAVLAPYVAGLVAAPPHARGPLRRLGVESLSLPDVLDALPPAPDPAGWYARYAGLSALAADPADREALAALAVPLADGRLARGPRGLLLPADDLTADPSLDLAGLVAAGVRLVAPGAAHPLLARLGARPASARQLLEDAAVRDLVEGSPDSDDPDQVASIVLGLVSAAVAAGELGPGDLPWLGDLALDDADGELAPAAALALPGSAAADVFEPEEIGLVAPDTVERWGAATLRAVGVLDALAVVRASEVDLLDPPPELAQLDGFEEWAAQVGGGRQVSGDLVAVRDLDAVHPAAWPEAVRLLADDRETRAAVLEPVRLAGPDGAVSTVPPYTAWWLGHRLGLSGRRDPEAGSALAGLLDELPPWAAELDPALRRALGAVRDLGELGPEALQLLMSRLGAAGATLTLPALVAAWSWLARVGEQAMARAQTLPAPPASLAAIEGPDLRVAVVSADEAVVVDSPQWLQRTDAGPLVLAPAGLGEALADVLDLPLAAEAADGSLAVTDSAVMPVPPQVRDLLAATGPDCWHRHIDLRVGGAAVRWWVADDGSAHAVDEAAAALALAWAGGSWSRRHLVAAVLAGAAQAAAATMDAAFD